MKILSLLFLLVLGLLLISNVSSELQSDYGTRAVNRLEAGLTPHETGAAIVEEDPPCRAVREINAHKQCTFTKRYCGDEDDGLVSYFPLYYCQNATIQPLIVLFLVLWLVFLFSVLGITAGDYLAINLGSIAQGLNMSDTLAGVTFLALGNGAPDVFSTIAAMKNSSDSLAIGELLGAAAFITGVIPGSMALIRSFDLVKSSLIRDAAFLLITIAFLMYVMSDGYLRLWHCLTLLATYIVYIIVVMSWHWWLSRRSKKENQRSSGRAQQSSDSDQETDPLLPRSSTPTGINTSDTSLARPPTGIFARAFHDFVPAISAKNKYRLLHIVAQAIMLPASIALKFTIPRIEEKTVTSDSEASRFSRRRSSNVSIRPTGIPAWSRWSTIIQTFTAPQLIIWLVSKQLDGEASENLVPCMIALGASILLSLLIFFTSSAEEEPSWYQFLCVPGFIVSIAWISMLADEIVAVLKILGVISNIPDAIMGITVFAFGNSVDDWAANISVARHERPVMALSACFGGPLFNILLGLSVSGIMVIVRDMKSNQGEKVAIALDPGRSLFIVAGTAMLCIVGLLLSMTWTKWKMTRPVGYVLTGLWLACTIVNVVLEATM